MLGYLRIFLSVVCISVCVLLVGLSLRSYRWNDKCELVCSNAYVLDSQLVVGKLVVSVRETDQWDIPGFYTGSEPVENARDKRESLYDGLVEVAGFAYYRDDLFRAVIIPGWSLIATFVALATLPWIEWSWRFSFRTMLLAVSIFAFLFCAGVYL